MTAPGNAAASTVTAATRPCRCWSMRSTPRRRPASNTPSSTTRSSATTRNGGEPGGNIRTAFLYRTDRVDFVDGLAAHGRRPTARRSPIRPATPTSRPIPTIRSSLRGRRWSPPSRSTARRSRSSTTTSPRRAAAARCSARTSRRSTPARSSAPRRRRPSTTSSTACWRATPDAKVLVAGDFNELPNSRSRWRCCAGAASISNYDVPGSRSVRGDGDLHPGRHRGPARPAATAAGRRALRLRVRGQCPDARPHAGDRRPAGGRRSSTSCASTPSSPTRPATTIRWWRASRSTITRRRTSSCNSCTCRTARRACWPSRPRPTWRRWSTAFDDDYANTLILSGGDNFLPGPVPRRRHRLRQPC